MLHGETTSHKEHEVHNGNQIEILFARCALWSLARRGSAIERAGRAAPSATATRKNREEDKFPSRVEVWTCDLECFEVVIRPEALMPLSFC
jgi:hypothetical protein